MTENSTTRTSLPKPTLTIISIVMVILGVGLRWYWILNDRIPFNSDEAVVGLMARHILAGERPIFFYGQSYMGSLDAWLNALGFRLLGDTTAVMRAVQTVLWLGLLVSIFFLAKRVYCSSRAGWWCLLLLSFPPVGLVLYSTASLGGYLEAFIIGIWCLYLAIGHHQQGESVPVRPGYPDLLLLGFLSGFGLWAFGFSLLFSIPAILFTLVRLSRFRMPGQRAVYSIGSLIIGGIVGASPWLFYALQHGLGLLLKELGGSAVAVETGGVLSNIGIHLVGFFLLGLPAALGLRPPWTVQWLLLPLIPFVLFLWGWLIVRSYHQPETKTYQRLLLGPIGLLLIVFVFSSFGVDPSGRYFLPITLMGVVMASGGLANLELTRKKLPYLAAAFIVCYQLAGSIQAERTSRAGLTTQFAPNTEIDHTRLSEVTKFLSDVGETKGYTTYWISYPAAYLSSEEVILIPRLPYHHDFRYTDRDDRYPPYTAIVGESDQHVLVTFEFPALDDRIRELLSVNRIAWEEHTIGGYKIFYHLDKPLPMDALDSLYAQGEH